MITAVTGAAGHVGANLVRALLERGRAIRVLVREDRRALEGLDVELVEGDILDTGSLDRLLRGAEVVYHAAGRISLVGSEGGLVERTNVQGVRNVVEACLRSGVRRLVHFSSIHAFRSPRGRAVIDEASPLVMGDHDAPYDASKAAGQREVLRAAAQGLDAVIVNPTAMIGPFDYKLSRMGEVLLDVYHRRLPLLVDGGYDWVDSRDVAAGAMAAEERGRRGECYLLSGHWVHICELSALVGRLTGRPTPRGAAPLWLAMPAAAVTLVWAGARGKTPKFTPAAITALRTHRYVSHAKATRELGWQPRPFEQTIRDTLEWFRQAGMLSS
jgi:dihydroflavonol-4-reductase